MPLFLILIIGSLISGMLTWMAYGFPGLLHLTHHVSDFCQSFLVKCVEYSDIFKLAFLWTGIAVLASGFGVAFFKGVIGLVKANRAIKKLPLSKGCGSVLLIKDKFSKTAFTHGLFRPKIYLSTGLTTSLDREELNGVFLHELHHKRHFDPLRFFLLNFLRDTFFYIPYIKHLADSMRFKREKKADDAAVAALLEPLSLAGALVKVAAFNKDLAFMPVSIIGGKEEGMITGRIKRLVEGGEIRLAAPSKRSLILSFCMTAFLAASLALPLNASFPGASECSTQNCSLHLNKPGADCEVHCKESIHRH